MSKPAANLAIIQKLKNSNKKHDKHNKTIESDSGITEDMQLMIELYNSTVTVTLANLLSS